MCSSDPHDPDVYYCLSQVVRKRDIPAAITALERYVALSSAPGFHAFRVPSVPMAGWVLLARMLL